MHQLSIKNYNAFCLFNQTAVFCTSTKQEEGRDKTEACHFSQNILFVSETTTIICVARQDSENKPAAAYTI